MEISSSETRTPYQILPLQDPRWMDFISSHPGANLFHHPIWSQFLSACYGYRPFILSVLHPSGQIVAGVPFMEISQFPFRRRLVALPFTDHCAPLYQKDSLDLFTQSLCLLYANSRIRKLEMRWDVPSLPASGKDTTHVLHTLSLEKDADCLLTDFHAAHRRNLKTAQNCNLEVEFGTGEDFLRRFYQLHLETRHRQGMPIQPWHFFQLLGKYLLEPGFGFVLQARKNDVCVASSIFLHWHGTLIYKFGASTESGLPFRPNNLLMWTAIQWGCENGCTHLDFGKSDVTNEGLRRFKLGFGAREQPLVYSILSDHRQGSSNMIFFKIMKRVIRYCPAWVCRTAGEVFYRYAG